MSIITACKLLNHLNETGNEEFYVGTQWSDLQIKIIIVRADNAVLVGEIFLLEFNKYARAFEKTLEEYLKDTEDILSGKNDEVQYFLEDQKFYWKKKRWYLGQINIKLVNEFECMKDFTVLLIDQYSKLKNCIIQLHKNNEYLKNNNSKLTSKLNKMILLKNEFEKKLYKKFILLINTKKAKIGELKSKLDQLKKKNCIYDVKTDESDNESNALSDFTSHSKLIEKSIKKRLLNEDFKKLNEKRSMQLTPNLGEDEETPDLLFDESECEVELKFEEENLEDVRKHEISIIQEDSEEEMF
ncbi:PREDICTED: uncharacterized protein LOC105361137 [Ceratosolen solmsi marchali]|uniref:Uncharacterized protein LOC105361137 n=1 Tax=Ceratosolen solmsi marchali TaxID=326594 RepID=A0AAJ7DU55_9HYME|nr:PREDICTED: uncharacterized protein LOC105361137 [Ceratosolen solmsi marchali]